MTTNSLREPISSLAGFLSFEDDSILAKIHSVGTQATLAILLSLVGLGSAMGQSIDQDMTLGANTQATRDRVVLEIRQARADGTIKRWSPVLVEVPFKAPLKGSRFESFSTHQADGDHPQFVRGDSSASRDITNVAPHTAQ